jgi:DME family drug/metabolite transporter
MKGATFIILAAVSLGTIGTAVKLIDGSVSPFLIAFMRVMFGSFFILLFVALKGKLRDLFDVRHDIRVYLVAGFFGVFMGMGFFVKSLTIIPVMNALFLDSIYPVATAILSVVFLKERIGLVAAAALGLALSGVWFLYGASSGASEGYFGSMFALFSGIGYSVLIVSMRYMETSRHHSYWKATFWPLFLGGLMLMPLVLSEPVALAFSPGILGLLVFLGLVPTFLSYVLFSEGLQTVRAHDAPLIMIMVEPVAAALLASAVLGEYLTYNILIGGGLILAANVLVEASVKLSGRKFRQLTIRMPISKPLASKDIPPSKQSSQAGPADQTAQSVQPGASPVPALPAAAAAPQEATPGIPNQPGSPPQDKGKKG